MVRIVAAAAAIFAATAPALASDGVIEINQAVAMKGAVNGADGQPRDPPGKLRHPDRFDQRDARSGRLRGERTQRVCRTSDDELHLSG
jgi:hypothetical protein